MLNNNVVVVVYAKCRNTDRQNSTTSSVWILANYHRLLLKILRFSAHMCQSYIMEISLKINSAGARFNHLLLFWIIDKLISERKKVNYCSLTRWRTSRFILYSLYATGWPSLSSNHKKVTDIDVQTRCQCLVWN